ncbi:MAG: amidohydrolase [Rubrivivax sp.]|nr:MAG: amidohydrolase [Rubrivivax sp.]
MRRRRVARSGRSRSSRSRPGRSGRCCTCCSSLPASAPSPRRRPAAEAPGRRGSPCCAGNRPSGRPCSSSLAVGACCGGAVACGLSLSTFGAMKFSAAILAIALLSAGCQTFAATPADISARTDRAFDGLVALRRDIHAHPELPGNEVRTAARVAARLRELGLDVQVGLHGHSVIGILKGGMPGRTVAWRSELDAVAVDSRETSPFKSQTPGVHHACGHDVHMAIALGMAEVLAAQRERLHGNVVFIFQPEEESFQGAKGMVDRGLFDKVRVDEIYGVHVTALPVGQIVVRPGEIYAHQRRIRIALKDDLPAPALEQLAQRVQGALVRSRPGAKPWELQHMADPKIGMTSLDTAFQDYLIMDVPAVTRPAAGTVYLEANLYETDAARLDGLPARAAQVVETSGHGRQLVGVSYIWQTPTVLNDPPLTRAALQTIGQAFGADAIQLAYGQAPFFNDDFAYFQQRVPGVYFILGASNAAKGVHAMNHTPDFAVDEESIRTGVKTFATLLATRLGQAP